MPLKETEGVAPLPSNNAGQQSESNSTQPATLADATTSDTLQIPYDSAPSNAARDPLDSHPHRVPRRRAGAAVVYVITLKLSRNVPAQDVVPYHRDA